MAQPRSPDDIFADFQQRRSGLLQALTDGGWLPTVRAMFSVYYIFIELHASV